MQTTPGRSPILSTFRAVVLTAAVLAVALGGSLTARPAGSIENGAVVSYAATQVVPPPPPSTFAATAGGDGWTVATDAGNVYTVFHHQTPFVVACITIATATGCDGYPKTIYDPHEDLFTAGMASIWIDPTTHVLYAWASTSAEDGAYDQRAGVVAVDLTASGDPYLGFIPLTGTSQAPDLYVHQSGITNAVIVGTKWYAFNYVVAGSPSGERDSLLCFDLVTKAACAGQPFGRPPGDGSPYVFSGSGGVWYVPAASPNIAVSGTRIVVPVRISVDDSWVGCYDVATDAQCTGSWPIPFGAGGINFFAGSDPDRSGGGVFPSLAADGTPNGFCFDGGIDSLCVDHSGTPFASQPPGLHAALDGYNNNEWNGGWVTVGSRMYVPFAWSNTVGCYDFAAGASCADFPAVVPDVSGLYTVAQDPKNPTCLWTMSHEGTGVPPSQIRTLDAFTGGPCGEGGTRVLIRQFVEPLPECAPLSYTRLQILAPLPSAYSGGTVTFQDAAGDPIPGIPTLPVAADGTVDLTPYDLRVGGGLPQMLVDLPGAESDTITLGISWTAAYHAACTAGGQEVTALPDPPAPVPDPTFTG